MVKQKIKKLINFIGIYGWVERINFVRVQTLNKKKNNSFVKKNPNIKLPPDFYLYETFGLDYDSYYYGGKKSASWIFKIISIYKKIENVTILDWGCGPGRILRHVSDITNNSNIFGSDYNTKYVEWCNKNLQNVTIITNRLTPPLNFEDSFFDIIYVISIFTHLSDEMHQKWIQELFRVSKKNAVLFITTHGETSKFKLSTEEQTRFENGKLVEHKYKIEGNRLYSSYQPKKYFKTLVENNGFRILEHIERGIQNGKPTQDVWLLKKP